MSNEPLPSPDNENTAAPNSPTDDAPPQEKPPRSKVERVVVWTLIGGLLIVTAMEGASQYGYKNTLNRFEAALAEAEETITLKEFHRDICKGLPIKTTGNREGEPTILYKWPSVWRQYEMHFTLHPGAEQEIATYSTGNGPGAIVGPTYQGGGGEGGGDLPGEEETEPMSESRAEDGPVPGGRRRRARHPLQALVSDPIPAELQLTEEQQTQIEEWIESQPPPADDLSAEERAQLVETQRTESLTQLEEILGEEQFARAFQILLHLRGVEALTQEDVADKLELTTEQREQIAAHIATEREKRQELFGQVRSGEIDRGERREKMAELRSETSENVLAVLTAPQQQEWDDLRGPAPPESERSARRPRRE